MGSGPRSHAHWGGTETHFIRSADFMRATLLSLFPSVCSLWAHTLSYLRVQVTPLRTALTPLLLSQQYGNSSRRYEMKTRHITSDGCSRWCLWYRHFKVVVVARANSCVSLWAACRGAHPGLGLGPTQTQYVVGPAERARALFLRTARGCCQKQFPPVFVWGCAEPTPTIVEVLSELWWW